MPRSSTTFQPGRSGNPGGRPKAVARVRKKAQAKAERALDVLLEVMEDTAIQPAARASAAEKVLRLAGAAMSEEKPAEGAPPPQTPVTKPDNLAALEAAATEGNA